MLEDLRDEFILSANKIGNWKAMTKFSLAKGYVENENNPELRDSYFSAFALRYWHEIFTLYKECKFLVDKLHLTIYDIADWYFEALMDVFKYRAFMNSDVFTYIKDGDEDKFINGYVYRAIDSTRERYFQYYNYDKRKAGINSSSLNTMIEERGDFLSDDSNTKKYIKIDNLIRKLVCEDELYEALVIYAVSYCDSFSKVYDEGVCKTKYSPKKLANIIKELSEDEINDFVEKYADGKDISFLLEIFRYYDKQWVKMLYLSAIDKLKNMDEVKEICY